VTSRQKGVHVATQTDHQEPQVDITV